MTTMAELAKTIKLHLLIDPEKKVKTESMFENLTERYASACNEISQYIFNNGFILNYIEIQKVLYQSIREKYGLKSQMAISSFKTVTARYKTVEEQLFKKPFEYQDENGVWQSVTRTLDWLWKPVCFKRPQADLVYNRDYSFIEGRTKLSINTLGNRVKVSFDLPKCFESYFDSTWKFGTAKLVCLKGQWYLHISATKAVPDSDALEMPAHVVGIDRGLRNILTTYDEKGKCGFSKGKEILDKRANFIERRAELQSRGTKSAKRRLKILTGRENRWMTDVNHQLSKTLVDHYGPNTLFVMEDLTGVLVKRTCLTGPTMGVTNFARGLSISLSSFCLTKLQSQARQF